MKLKSRLSYVFCVNSFVAFCLIIPCMPYSLSTQTITLAICSIVQLILATNSIVLSIWYMLNDNSIAIAPKMHIVPLKELLFSVISSILTILYLYQMNKICTYLIIDTISKAYLLRSRLTNKILHRKMIISLLIISSTCCMLYQIQTILFPVLCYIVNISALDSTPGFISGIASTLVFYMGISTTFWITSIPFSYLIPLFFNIDTLNEGSKNPGATNLNRLVLQKRKSKSIIFISGIADIMKAAVPVCIMYRSNIVNIIHKRIMIIDKATPFMGVTPEFVNALVELIPALLYSILSGIALSGNIWSPFLRFRGGLGAACFFGIMIGFASKSYFHILIMLSVPVIWLVLTNNLKRNVPISYADKIEISAEHITIPFYIAGVYLPFYKGVVITMIASVWGIFLMWAMSGPQNHHAEFIATVFSFVCVVLRHDIRKGFVDLSLVKKIRS